MRRFFLALALLAGTGSVAAAKGLVFLDPSGDDDGPGTYKYPTDSVYIPGSFDMTKLEVIPKGNEIEFRVTMRSRIGDPWGSKDWGGNGFSLQMVQIYIDKDRKVGSGHCEALPGMNADFEAASCWEKVVVLTPQGRERVMSEIELKAKKMARDIVVPRRTYAVGRMIVGIVSKAALGGSPSGGWGFQAVVQSNEGFPDKADFLLRKVNEIEGPHRFGGGDDSDCDPHVLDLLGGDAKGARSEIDLQHRMLGSYICKTGVKAKLSMVYRDINNKK